MGTKGVDARPGSLASNSGARFRTFEPLEDRRLLLQLYRIDPIRVREGPDAVDWLLTGAVLAALVVLVVTARIEQRLSASLRNLVRLADTLLRGEPPGDVARPPETDLAGVLSFPWDRA